MASSLLPPLVVLLLVLRPSAADIATDQAECTNQLVGLATCLPYVQGGPRSPTPDCCTGLKAVLDKSPKCLCLLIKDRDDPKLGIKINASLALGLPDKCGMPVRLYECPKILKLPPNSPEAQIFMQPKKAVQGDAANSTTVKGDQHESSGGKNHHLRKRECFKVEKFGVMFFLLVLCLL